MIPTIVQDCGYVEGNHLFVKREDLMPYSFGGNKVRKAALFFQEIDAGHYDCVVTYGSGSSNHCRIISNMCASRGLPCHIISPMEASEPTFNAQLMELFGARITTVPVSEVHDAIEGKIRDLKTSGKRPYFIEGGGHGYLGTEAYVQCYREIEQQEKEMRLHFDYIFFASGTGTTHAGLVCGQLLAQSKRKIVGISIARKNPRGREVVLESIRSYLNGKASEERIQEATTFIDDYTTGYGKNDKRVAETIERVLKNYGIPLDATYTGKAFMGMRQYIDKEQLTGKNILFIHTGGTPLFFDALKKQSEEV